MSRPHPSRARAFWPRLALTLGLISTGLIALAAAPQSAEAFCGFYVSGAEGKLFNNATMVVMMRDGKRTVLSMQNNYQGPPKDFAMVVPVPVVLQKDNVKTLPQEVFDKVDKMAAPRLVEYWEQDPCFVPKYEDEEKADFARPTAVRNRGATKGRVTIEAQFEVGEYEVVILSAKDSGGLNTWLKQNKYNIPDGAEPVLKPYVEGGMYFFVAKVNVKKVKFGPNQQAMLSPLRFYYDSDTFSLPVRLGLLNAKGAQDLIVHILARGQRYEMANLPNATIPTNLEVADEVRNRFGEFYAALFDKTLEKNPGAVVTEYSWDASTCDPCPGPNLNGRDFLTLGADVLKNTPRRGFVLTRLHARYTKDQLKEDLVFKAAPPIMGGREVYKAEKQLERGAQPGGMNNFQGRYIIRHRWEGPIACDNPRRGIWGGPPAKAQKDGYKGTQAAQNTAFAERKKAALPKLVREDVPEIGLVSTNAPKDATPQTKDAAKQPAQQPKAQDTTPKASPPKADTNEGSGMCTQARVEAPRGSGSTALGLFVALCLLGAAARRRRDAS